MRKIIALLACLWALCAGATNITNYPVRTTFNSAYWFLLSDVTAQTNWNLPGNYVASTTDLNTSSNILWGFTTNVNFTNIYVTNLVVLSNAYFFSTNQFNTAYITNLYSSNTWIISLTVTNPITNISLTANTIVKSDANKALASVANGTGALTNNNAGLFGWFTYASLQDITNTVQSYTNTFMSATNLTFTNGTLLVKQIAYLTNTGTMAPDFAKGYDAISTNASFQFLDPINTETSGKYVETTVKLVENSSGSAIVATPFANCIVISNSYMGVGANGATWFTFVRYGTQKTNVYSNAETH